MTNVAQPSPWSERHRIFRKCFSHHGPSRLSQYQYRVRNGLVGPQTTHLSRSAMCPTSVFANRCASRVGHVSIPVDEASTK